LKFGGFAGRVVSWRAPPAYFDPGIGVRSDSIVIAYIKETRFMETHFNINTAGGLYVQHFNVALMNFEKHVREERKFRKLRRKHSISNKS
jgi:hypothetical protein